jgi:hypothetical protein
MHSGPDDPGERFVAVLEIPNLVSAEAAIKGSIVTDGKATDF